MHIGSTIDLDGVSRVVVGTVENPSDLGDEFALLPPSALAESKFVTMLVDASEASASVSSDRRATPGASSRHAAIFPKTSSPQSSRSS